MPELGEYALIANLVLAIAVALIGGAIAYRLGQPVILGYMLAGMAIGPFTPGPVGDVRQVQVMAEIGVAFLMFALGVEFSISELKRVRNVAVFGGIAQILLCIALGLGLSPLLGLSFIQGVFFGSIIALSSTMVALKILMDRGELDSLHGRIATGFLIIQDLSVVPLIVILPALALPQSDLLIPLGTAIGKAVLILVITYYLGTLLVPRILFAVASTQSRELFLLTVVTLALGTAVGTYLAGLSLAFGAFLAGLVVSESAFNRQILAEALPLRDIFATLFFVAVGMLINPSFLLQNAPLIILLVAVVVVGKFVISTALTFAFGYPPKVAVYTGLALIQIGEFSFVLARTGVDRALIPQDLYATTLAVALGTILLSPTALRAGPFVMRILGLIPGLGSRLEEVPEVHFGKEFQNLIGHTVICGYGRIGRELADALERRAFSYLVIEYNPHVIAELRDKNVPCIYGDASNIAVLEHANLDRARVLAVTLPSSVEAKVAIQRARTLNSRIDIIARVHRPEELHQMWEAGANEVVAPEFEAALEFIRHTMHRYGVSSAEALSIVGGRRASYYRREQ